MPWDMTTDLEPHACQLARDVIEALSKGKTTELQSPMTTACIALVSIAESAKRIANALENPTNQIVSRIEAYRDNYKGEENLVPGISQHDYKLGAIDAINTCLYFIDQNMTGKQRP